MAKGGKRPIKWSLRATVISIIVAGIVVPALFLVALEPKLSSATDPALGAPYRHDILNQAAASLEALPSQNALEPWLQKLLAHPDVCAIELDRGLSRPPGPARYATHCASGLNLYWAEIAVNMAGASPATLRIGFEPGLPTALLQERRWAMWRLVGLQLALGTLAMLAVMGLLLLRPLRRLKHQAMALAAPGRNAEEATTLRWKRSDEIGELGQQLNQASGRIADLVGELENSNVELRRLAMYDQLTGLPNRRLFKELYDHAQAVARRSRGTMALMFIDLDRFKQINDAHGHAAGDVLLLCISQRLRDTARESDIIGRLSGDEFVALLPQAQNFEAIAHTALRLIHAIEEPVVIDAVGTKVRISATIGVARFPRDGEDFDDLLRHADQAMYRAKSMGRGRYALYRDGDIQAMPAPLNDETDTEIQHALTRQELMMFFHPVVDTRTGQSVGTEALMRWRHPHRGLLTPSQFIRRAEKAGLLHQLAARAIELACAQVAAWKGQGRFPGSIAINVSDAQFRHEDWLETLRIALKKYRVEPGELEVELTEATLMSDPEHTDERVRALREMGVGLVIDDFGSGMFSLTRLMALQPNRVKLDPTFVQSMEENESSRKMVASMVRMGRGLGWEVIAEGVETTSQRDMLGRLGCPLQQGYLFGEPQAAQKEPPWPLPTWSIGGGLPAAPKVAANAAMLAPGYIEPGSSPSHPRKRPKAH